MIWALIRKLFMKGASLEDGIKAFTAANKGITKSDGQKLINIFEDVKKNTATVTDLQKFKDKKGIKSIPVKEQFTTKPNVEDVYFDNPNDPRLFKPDIKNSKLSTKEKIFKIDDELEKLSTGEGKYAKMNRNDREDLMIKLQDESSTLQKTPGVAEGKFNDEFRSFKLNIAKNNPEFNQDLAKQVINREIFKDATTEQRKQVLDALEFVLKNPEGMASGGIAGQLHMNEGGRIGYAQGTKKPGEGQYSPTKDKAWMQTMPQIDPRLRDLMREYKKRKGLAEILGV